MQHATADLCDEHIDKLQVAEPIFMDLGGSTCFEGEIHTLKVFEDNTFVRATLEKDGAGKVLVVDGGGCSGREVGAGTRHSWQALGIPCYPLPE